MKYSKKPFVTIKVAPQVAGERLELIRTQNAGRLTPELVVVDAKPKRSPLHNEFEWNDTKAAKRYRVVQAAYLIRAIVVVTDEAPDAAPVRAFINVEDDDRYYTSIHHAMSDAELRNMVINRALKEVTDWQSRYESLSELAAVFSAIKKVKRRKRK